MELLTNVHDNKMSMTRIETVNNKVVVSVVKFKDNLNVDSDRRSFRPNDMLNKNQFIIDSILGHQE
jgi:hypothetical protein